MRRSPPAALASALAQAESAPLRLLAALAFVKEADPGLSAAEAEALAQAWAVPTTPGLAGAGEAVAQRLPKETLPEGRLPEESPAQTRRPAWDPEQAPPSVESAPAEPEAHRDGAPEALITHCAGLLFLLRPLARLGFLDRSPRPRLLALGREALQRVLSPLGPAARQRALDAETPLLQVFSGLEPLPDPDPQEEAELIQEVLDRLCQALPQDLSPRPQDLLTVLPGLPGVLALPEPQRPLAGLLLRTARLSLDPVSATLRFTSDQIDLALRRGGWDIDPGWFPPVGRVIRFVYEEPR